MVLEDGVGEGVAEKLATGARGVEIVIGIDEFLEAIVAKKAGMVGIS